MDKLCRACFDGVYPIELPLAERLGKHVLEDEARTSTADHRAAGSGWTPSHAPV